MCEEAPDEIKILAKGPMLNARKYSSYSISGLCFHTKSYDEGRPIQNSGVAVVAEATTFDMGNNDHSRITKNAYYGIIKEIVELNYHHKGNVVLFKCDWVDNRVQDKWVQTDNLGVTSVNFKHLFNTGEKISDEPFILASQAIQVYYVPEAIDHEWAAAVQSKARDVYDLDNLENEHMDNGNGVAWPLHDLSANVTVDIVNGVVPSFRTDIDGTLVVPQKKKPKKSLQSKCCLSDACCIYLLLIVLLNPFIDCSYLGSLFQENKWKAQEETVAMGARPCMSWRGMKMLQRTKR